ncbi:TetR/AcrR family transcriptional regulator [Paraglaciecola aquimarina]|uniref:TetR/AcrR family transcriptional regulator n=1 Tax=Paraglaciecola algarum TaxID=3050085 RepID=A0ABS9D6X8_9ALTE|nr:TetR/AcrR family transcriptional regulator [Paraglaciecola sp. G1-23]MCF2948708.1 TetR/AcrR family transcriptional regulator [Paraglaciecola sp. G1-23]
MVQKQDLETDFDPNETPTGKYKAGKIRDENIANILQAAEEVFVQYGFKGTSIQAIADKANIAKANVHYYFKSKSNLYVAVLGNLMHLWNDFFDQVTEDDDPATVLDEFIRKKVALSYSHPRASKLFAMEIIQGAPHLKDYIRTDMRQWVRTKAKVIQSWIDQGRMAQHVDPVQLIFLIWSSTQHYADFEEQVLTIMNCAEYEQEMIDNISNFLSQMILTGCGLTPPQR